MDEVNDRVGWRRGNLWQISIAGIAIVGAVGLSMLNQWEMTPEAWGYWFFARVFAESGRFIVLDRGPLYTLYLNGFRWLGYPGSVTVEYLVTSVFSVVSLLVFFRPYLGLGLAVLSAVLWIPFLQQVAEPPVQRIALALMCWAVVVRQAKQDRFGLAVSYALLGLAYMFRPTSIVAILIFATWDILRILQQNGLTTLRSVMIPRRKDWPIGLVLVLFIWIATMQSPHPWNNVWAATTRWFPNDGKSIADGAFIQNFNVAYILRKYGSLEGKDFYFTNQELFGRAGNMLQAVRSNPQFVVEQLAINIRNLPGAMIQLTELQRIPLVPSRIIIVAGSIAILYGAFRASKSEAMILFLVINAIHLGITALSYVKVRWMYPAIPILILSAYWYGVQLNGFTTRVLSRGPKALLWSGVVGLGLLSLYLIFRVAFTPVGPVMWSAAVIGYVISVILVAVGKFGSQDATRRWSSFLSRLAVPVMLVILSNGTSWINAISVIVGDIRRGELHVLERGHLPSKDASFNMKASFTAWNPLLHECKGILALESTFIGAFADVPMERVYDIWEIPPFGQLDASVYDRLHPNRIDCVLVSEMLATEIGGGTNWQIRYESYIKPYVRQLQGMGAMTYDIPRFGQAIILPKSEGKV